MAKKHSMPEMKEGGVNVTPLIDVVMCLIIFFMLVAKIGVATGAAPMELPTTIMGKKTDQLGDTLFINVIDPAFDRDEATGQRKLDAEGKPIPIPVASQDPEVRAAFDEKTEKPQQVLIRDANRFPFREQLIAIYNARKKAGKEEQFSVTVRAEKDLPFSKFQVVLAEIATAGIRNVNYATNEPRGGTPAPGAPAE